MLGDRAVLAAIAVLVAGCSFQLTATTDGGGGDDTPPLPTVGFTETTSIRDESSGLVMITVELSEPAAAAVTVPYSFAGSATEGTDFSATTGPLSFGIGDRTKTIDVTIVRDTVGEPDEQIVIALGSPNGAQLGADTHTLTISANTLPRVTLGMAASSGNEGNPQTITFTLDKAANGPATVNYSVAGVTAQAIGAFADFTLASGTVTFAQGSVMETVSLVTIEDLRNELAETLSITLTTATGVLVEPAAGPTAQIHTIVDDDAVPSVRFVTASSSVTEGDTGTAAVTLDVTLSAASGRTVTVPFAVNVGTTTATNPGDYTLVGTSVTFVEGVTTQSITVNVVGDTVNESSEILALALTAPADGSATLGTQPTRQLTITDNDPYCQGSGNFRVCYPAAPTAAVVLSGTLDTGSSGLCAAAQPTGWSTQGQPAACFVVGTNITMSGNTVVTGSRPLVLFASMDISISQTLDAASHRGVSGPAPGSPFSGCPAFLATPGGSNGAGGGAGATFMSQGGNGGTGDGGNANPAGIAPGASSAPTVLRAGCDGQRGGDSGNTAGAAGDGGGALYLVAAGTITISGEINVSGSAGSGGDNFTGGSGAGSGGMIWLQAATIVATGGTLIANGGGGSSGGDNNNNGNDGGDPLLASPTTPAPGGSAASTGAAGGAGFAGSTLAAPGGTGGSGKGGGGGGGGGGYIKASAALTGAAVSAGLVQAP